MTLMTFIILSFFLSSMAVIPDLWCRTHPYLLKHLLSTQLPVEYARWHESLASLNPAASRPHTDIDRPPTQHSEAPDLLSYHRAPQKQREAGLNSSAFTRSSDPVPTPAEECSTVVTLFHLKKVAESSRKLAVLQSSRTVIIHLLTRLDNT